jgi:hypothetical protein
MPNVYNDLYVTTQKCALCMKPFEDKQLRQQFNNKVYCSPCWDKFNPEQNTGIVTLLKEQENRINDKSIVQDILKDVHIPQFKSIFNEPEHYHKHEIDTIEFLKRGFPPQVFMGFAIGHIIKYAQRAEYKNGREDFVKMVDYAKRALDWYDETHEKELGK